MGPMDSRGLFARDTGLRVLRNETGYAGRDGIRSRITAASP
jgi:hypothetical protein